MLKSAFCAIFVPRVLKTVCGAGTAVVIDTGSGSDLMSERRTPYSAGQSLRSQEHQDAHTEREMSGIKRLS